MGRPLAPPGTNPLGGPVVHLDAVGSTNDRARELATQGAPKGTVVLAEEQTAGRGRQGRAWLAPRGRALTLSAIVHTDLEAIERLPLTAAIAVCEAGERAAAVTCSIKWPNDIWIDERKVAGILIEARPQEGWAVVGIGLNVDANEDEFPPELRGSATSLRIAAGASGGRERALEALLERLGAWLSAPDGETVLSAFRARDALYGRRIAWTRGERRLEGEARGADARGNLVVFDDDGLRTVLDAGEVHLARS